MYQLHFFFLSFAFLKNQCLFDSLVGEKKSQNGYRNWKKKKWFQLIYNLVQSTTIKALQRKWELNGCVHIAVNGDNTSYQGANCCKPSSRVAHMDMILFKAFLKNIHLIPENQIAQLHYDISSVFVKICSCGIKLMPLKKNCVHARLWSKFYGSLLLL